MAGALALALLLVAGLRPSTRPVLFRVAAVAIAPAALVLGELALSLVGAPTLDEQRRALSLHADPSAGFFQQMGTGQDPFLHVDQTWMRPQISPLAPPDGALRVAALGGSSVYGTDWLAEDTWPAVAGRRLQACLPDREVEVLNGGAVGALTGEVRARLLALEPWQPDVVLIYTGRNDFVFIPRLAMYEAFSPRLLEVRSRLGRSRVAALVAGLLPEPEPVQGEAFRRADEPGEQEWQRLRELVARDLEQRLRSMIREAREMGAVPILVTQVQNEEICGPGSVLGQDPWGDCFPPEARGAILAAAAAERAAAIDAGRAFAQDAGLAGVGIHYFIDDIHPSLAGHELLGEVAAAGTLEELGLAPARPDCGGLLPRR